MDEKTVFKIGQRTNHFFVGCVLGQINSVSDQCSAHDSPNAT